LPPVDGLTMRGAVEGGAWSSDFGPLRLRGVERQRGLTAPLAAAGDDPRHPSDIRHPLLDLIGQRPDQIAYADTDGYDANALRANRYSDGVWSAIRWTLTAIWRVPRRACVWGMRPPPKIASDVARFAADQGAVRASGLFLSCAQGSPSAPEKVKTGGRFVGPVHNRLINMASTGVDQSLIRTAPPVT